MSARRQMMIAAGGAVLVTVLFFLFVLKPKSDEITEIRDRVAAAESEELSLRADIARLEKAREDATETTAELATLNRYLPANPDLPGFIRLMQEAATKSGVDLRSIAPGPPSPRDNTTGIDQIVVSITVRGGFHRIEDLMTRIEGLPRVVIIDSMSLAPGEDVLSDQVILEGTVGMRMFVVQPNARIGSGSIDPTVPPPSAGGTS